MLIDTAKLTEAFSLFCVDGIAVDFSGDITTESCLCSGP
jgi:hypothetical protein